MRTVVFGASKGLGLSLTKRLLASGHRVAAAILERHPPMALDALTQQYGDMLLIKSADITDEDEIIDFAKSVALFMGKVDSLCTVAGVIMPGDIENPKLHTSDISDLRRTFEVNFFGPVAVVKYFYPHMEKGGKILTITSEGVNLANAYAFIPCYALSKTAATKASGVFNASVDDVDFYAVHPGRPKTDMNPNGEIEPEESAKGIYNIMAGKVPLSRDTWYIDYKANPMEL